MVKTAKKQIKAQLIIFDLDQTLLNSTACICNGINHMLKTLGFKELPNDKITIHIGLPLKRFIEVLVKKQVKEPELKEYTEKGLQAYKDYFKQHCKEECSLYPHVEEVIQTLQKKGKKLAIATTAKLELSVGLLKHLGILDYFEAIIGEEDISHTKPDPESLFTIMQRLGIAPEQTIMIGDTYMDVEAGRSAGARTIGVDYGIDSKDELKTAGAEIVISDLIELLDIIK